MPSAFLSSNGTGRWHGNARSVASCKIRCATPQQILLRPPQQRLQSGSLLLRHESAALTKFAVMVHTTCSNGLTLSVSLVLWKGVVFPELEQIRREAERLTSEISKTDWHHAPPGKWSCAQIFEHLLLSYTATTQGTLKAMEIGKPLGGRPTLRDRISTFYVAGLGLLPSGRAAPQQVTPKDGAGLESLRQFNDALVAMDATLADAEKRFGSRVKVLNHPVLGPLTAKEWRRFHRTHAKHHLRQIAERVRQGEPGNA